MYMYEPLPRARMTRKGQILKGWVFCGPPATVRCWMRGVRAGRVRKVVLKRESCNWVRGRGIGGGMWVVRCMEVGQLRYEEGVWC